MKTTYKKIYKNTDEFFKENKENYVSRCVANGRDYMEFNLYDKDDKYVKTIDIDLKHTQQVRESYKNNHQLIIDVLKVKAKKRTEKEILKELENKQFFILKQSMFLWKIAKLLDDKNLSHNYIREGIEQEYEGIYFNTDTKEYCYTIKM